MIVYGSSLSPFVRKVLIFGAEKGIELEYRPQGLNDPDPEFVAASPFGKMPGFRDGDFSISDSTAIVTYLEAIKPEPALIPAEPRDRARTIWFDEFSDTLLFGCGQKMFFNRIVAPRFLKMAGDQSLADKAEAEELPRCLDYLEGVTKDRAFLVGDALTLADIAVGSTLVNLLHLELPRDPARYPSLMAYRDRLFARESFIPWLESERKFMEKTRPAAA